MKSSSWLHVVNPKNDVKVGYEDIGLWVVCLRIRMNRNHPKFRDHKTSQQRRRKLKRAQGGEQINHGWVPLEAIEYMEVDQIGSKSIDYSTHRDIDESKATDDIEYMDIDGENEPMDVDLDLSGY